MERESTHKVNQDVKNQVVDFLLKKNAIEVPKVLINKEAHNMQHQAMQQLGVTDHEKAPPVENFKETAEKRVRLGLLLGQYVEENSLSSEMGPLEKLILNKFFDAYVHNNKYFVDAN